MPVATSESAKYHDLEAGCDLTEYLDCAGMLCYPHLLALVQLVVLHSQ